MERRGAARAPARGGAKAERRARVGSGAKAAGSTGEWRGRFGRPRVTRGPHGPAADTEEREGGGTLMWRRGIGHGAAEAEVAASDWPKGHVRRCEEEDG